MSQYRRDKELEWSEDIVMSGQPGKTIPVLQEATVKRAESLLEIEAVRSWIEAKIS